MSSIGPQGVAAADFSNALDEFAGVVGKDRVYVDEQPLSSYRDAYSPLADGEFLPGVEELDGAELRVPADGVTRRRGDVNGRFPFQRQRAQAADMVGVLVGDHQGVEAVGPFSHRRQAREGLALAEPGVNQQARLLRRHQRRVASAPTPQHTDPNAQTSHSAKATAPGAPEGVRDARSLPNYKPGQLNRKEKPEFER